MSKSRFNFAELFQRIEGSNAQLIVCDEKGVETCKTFAELHGDCQRLIELLTDASLSSGQRVGICSENCYEWIVWDLAIQQLDCVSVAFLPDSEQRDATTLIDHYQLSCIAGTQSFLEASTSSVHQELLLPMNVFQGDKADSLTFSVRDLEDNEDVLSLAFSSGTTGKSKVLIISQKGTEHLINLFAEAFGTEKEDRALNFLPFSNYQQRMIYSYCLFYGVDYVSVPQQLAFSGLKKYRPTFAIAPPIFYESLHKMALGLSAAKSDDSPDNSLQRLLGERIRYLITGMAAIKRDALDYFWQQGIALYEAYGITEAGMVAWNKPGHHQIGSVGQPAEPECVKISEEGEVIVSRKHLLSQGYLEASDEDVASTFLTDNQVATGDIAAFDEQGFIHIKGRKKDAIVTSSGEKFHPESIEKNLLQHIGDCLPVVFSTDEASGLTAVIFAQGKNIEQLHENLVAKIKQMNRSLPPFKHIKNLALTSIEPGVDNGFRTKNLKINRRKIADFFNPRSSTLEEMLSEVIK